MPQPALEEENQTPEKAIHDNQDTTINQQNYVIEPKLWPEILSKVSHPSINIKQQTKIKEAIKMVIEEDQIVAINHFNEAKNTVTHTIYGEDMTPIFTEFEQTEALTEAAVSEAVEEIMESTLLPAFEENTNPMKHEAALDKRQIIKAPLQAKANETSTKQDKSTQPNTLPYSQTKDLKPSIDIDESPEKQTIQPRQLLISIHELLPDTNETKIKKIETFVSSMPEPVRLRLIEHISSADQATLETSRVLIVKIAVAADRLNQLAKDDNLDSQEAAKIEELIQGWYLELLSNLEIEVDEQDLDNMIELVKSDTYLNDLPEEDSELVDEGTHERKLAAFFPPNIFTLIKSELHQALGRYAISSMA